jgi:hypothetical protein
MYGLSGEADSLALVWMYVGVVSETGSALFGYENPIRSTVRVWDCEIIRWT